MWLAFQLRVVRDELVTSVLGRGEVDLQISTVRPSAPAVQWRQLMAEPLRLAVPTGHPLARRTQIQLAEVSSEPFVLLRPTSLLRQLCEDLCAEAGFRPTLGFEGDDLPTVRGFVAAGIGLTWSTEHRLLPAAELFRQHTFGRAASRLLPAVARAG
ncbi:MAG TPA: LysR substrate-binding domain-containing protein [Dermatophilaceae bacterium]|nr:LysR substrate-binding domain-containing protein [Dermatophilaceae bacterium]